MFITVKEAAEKWGISERRIRVLCSEGKIVGAYQAGRSWKIPADAEKPSDGRYKEQCRTSSKGNGTWYSHCNNDVFGKGR